MSAPPPLTSTTFVDGENVNESKLYSRIFTVINYLLGVANVPGQTRFFGSIIGSLAITAGVNFSFDGASPWTIVEDTASAWNSSSHNWVCPSTGTYLIMAQGMVTGTATNIYILKNGANYSFASASAAAANYGSGQAIYVRLAVNDTIAMRSTVSYTAQSQSPAHANYLQIVQLSFV